MAAKSSKHSYNLPHGREENDRLDAQHHAIVELIGGRVYHAPLSRPSKILDVGCRSGVVTTHLAKCFPSAEVVGVDLAAPIDLSTKPDNVTYLQGDFFHLVESGVLKEGDFDFIFSRMLVVGMVDWPRYASTVSRLLKQGGWVEMQDLSWHLYDHNECSIDDAFPFVLAIQNLLLRKGLDPFCGEHLAEYMRSAGLRAVDQKIYPWAWTYWKNRPETRLIAEHSRSEEHIAVQNFLLEKLNNGVGAYTSEEIRTLKEENQTSAEKIREGMHYIFGVAYGQK
ncbi:hypothetical protein Asppvi_009916 [Aspergillus pseudoviridinutans]|uniref:S-adenosyl-L-methionine-dependent methyltransferase n=1 Tax=Aspergillus pseudoviridinutans TaxID=1517512 RepID=A0A9P3BNK2_9EURO|nr:uncharacterized protein Asppvi_009916 [Aspergillus pseudoviridinutans]GIJ90951.1 hypothetical protein Asppvi_009916 [Aspergillus pseudoviridinutans]